MIRKVKNADHKRAVERIKEYKRQAGVLSDVLRCLKERIRFCEQRKIPTGSLKETVWKVRKELSIVEQGIRYLKRKIYQFNSDYQCSNNGRKEPGSYRRRFNEFEL